MNKPQEDALMRQITAALEAVPAVAVPDDFSARLLAKLPAAETPRKRFAMPTGIASHYGRTAMFVAMLLLLAGMLWMAPHTRGSAVWMTLQAILFLQLGALLLWAGVERHRLL